MKITGHTIERMEDPTRILTGERYEILLNIEVSEDDELYSENGLSLRGIFVIEEKGTRLAQYHFIENVTNRYLDFELEEEEEQLVKGYCSKALESH
jgi:hypothetical protein